MVERAEKILTRALNYLDGELKGRKFLMGDEFYAVDIVLGCCLYTVRDHKLVQERSNIQRLLESYYSRPAFRRTLELNGT